MIIKKRMLTEKLDFNYNVNVNKDGGFTTYIPEDVIEKLEKSGIKLGAGRGYKKGYFASNSL